MHDHIENVNRNMETIINDQVEMKNKKLNKIDKKIPLSVSSVELTQSMKESVNLKTDQYKLQKITHRKGEKRVLEVGRGGGRDKKRYPKTVRQY